MGAGESHISAFESLLRQVARAPGYDAELEAAVVEPGTLVGERFEVVGAIGAGGFARVYEARDRVLSRPVALKLLRRRRHLSDREMALFYREARATARLNHPNIVTAFDWGESGGVPFLVLELLEGEPLADRLDSIGGEDQALAVVREIAEALRYAHDRSVLHLDLKAQNVVVQADGPVKVLDFGLAGLEWDDDAEEPRIDGGTPATMAPEQRRGDPVDARADIWAVGVILHQLLFKTLPPRSGELRETPPRRIAAILARTLAPDPAERYPDAGALIEAIDATRRSRRPAGWLVAAAIVAIGAVIAVLALSVGERDDVAGRDRSPPRHRQITFRGDVFQTDLSPDGERIAFLAASNSELWVQPIGSSEARRVFSSGELFAPRWLPDGERLVVASRLIPRTRWLVPAAGGEAVKLGTTPSDYTVGLGDSMVIANLAHQSVWIEPAGGGARTEIELPATKWVFDLDVGAGGRILVTTFEERGHLLELEAGALVKKLHREDAEITGARLGRDGEVFFAVGVGASGKIRHLGSGPGARPVTLLSGIEIGRGLAVSADGERIVYHRTHLARNLDRLSSDRNTITPITSTTAEVTGAAVSADGRTLALTVREGSRHSIQIGSIEPGASRRRIECRAPCGSPAWSPDGRLAVRLRAEGGEWRIAVLSADGRDRRLLERTRPTRNDLQALRWVSDRELIYMPAFNERLRVVDVVSGEDRDFLLRPGKGWMFNPVTSADRGRVAFFWNDGDRRGLYIADSDGSSVRRVLDGMWYPVAFDGPRRMRVAHIAGDDSIDQLGAISLDGGSVELSWEPASGYEAAEAVEIPGSDDLLLLRAEMRSDAWLMQP